MLDIFILPEGASRKGKTLTGEEQFALWSKLLAVMRISRIGRPRNLYDASVAAKASDVAGRAIANPIDSERVIRANFTYAMANIKFGRIPGFSEFLENKTKDANRVNLLNRIKRKAKRNLTPKCGIYFIWEMR